MDDVEHCESLTCVLESVINLLRMKAFMEQS